MPSDCVIPDRTFYTVEGDRYVPLPLALGPWHPRHQNGATIAGLVAHLLETRNENTQMPIARLAITILGPGLMAPFQASLTTLRESAKLSMRSVSLAQERVFATAQATRIRQMETPVYGVTTDVRPSPPENLPSMTSAHLSTVVTTRLLRGGLLTAGPGAMWAKSGGEIVPGHPVTPFVQAAILADFGSGLSGWIDFKQWTFANIDLDMHFLRAPRPGWHFVEAATESFGNGVAVTSTRLSDESGLFANSRQTLFIDKRTAP